jgi:protein-tyrosine-phosphatase
MTNVFNILFICTGNTCRSPMAEGALKRLLVNRGIENIHVASAGTAAASDFPATAYAAESVKIWDADISGHLSRPLTPPLITDADLILCMTPSHCHDVIKMVPQAKDKTFLLKNYPGPGCDGEGIEDPIGGPLDMYNQTFIEIAEEIGRILPIIIAKAEQKIKSGISNA